MSLINRAKNLGIVQPLVRFKYRAVPFADLFKDPKAVMLADAFLAADRWRLPGGYFEFGVFRGRAFVHAARLAQDSRRLFQRKLFAFDSFQGLSEPSPGEEDIFLAGEYYCTKDDFLETCRRGGVDFSRVEVHEGFFSDSLTAKLQQRFVGEGERAAIVWIDSDIYEPALQALNFVSPLLQSGTILCFDDWFSFAAHPMKGEVRAVREWLGNNPQWSLTEWKTFGSQGKAFLATRLP